MVDETAKISGNNVTREVSVAGELRLLWIHGYRHIGHIDIVRELFFN